MCGGLSLCGSPHHTHSRQLPTISSHSRARIRTPHACHHRCIPFHAVMATTGQCQTRAGQLGAGRPHGGGRQRGGSAAADSWSAPRRHKHCPPTHRGGGGVCVVVSASVALLTTLTPANSQPFPHIHAPEYARHTPEHHRCIPFHADMATTGQCLTRAGHAGRPQGPRGWAWRQSGGRVAAAWRQRGGRQLVGSEAAQTLPTNTQGWWWCVCGGLSLCGSPHHTHSRQLPTISSHSRARIRTPHACHHRCIPFHADMATTGQCLTRAGHAGRPHGGGSVAAAWRQGGGQRGGRQLVGSEAARTLPTNTQEWWWWCVCVWWSQPLWLSSPHSLPPTPNHFLTFTRPNTHATRLPPPLHPISCRHGHHRAVSNKGWACWPTTWWRQVAAGWRQRGGSAAADSWSAPRRCEHCPPTHRGGGCVCGGLSLCGSPHHTHSRQLPTISSHSRARIRTPHTCHHRCIPFHAVMATTGQCLTRAGHAGRPQGGPQGGGSAGWRQRGGSAAADSWSAPRRYEHCPPTHRGGGGGVCGGLSLCGSPHHTHSRQLPTISSHSRARIRTPHTCHHRCIPFHADMATTEQCLTRAGHAGRPHGWRQRGGSGGGRVAAARRQTAGRLRGSTNTAHQHTGVVVCVCVVVSASVALLTTLTPANSQPFPHIHAPEYARHTPATTVASHFMPTWPPQGSV